MKEAISNEISTNVGKFGFNLIADTFVREFGAKTRWSLVNTKVLHDMASETGVRNGIYIALNLSENNNSCFIGFGLGVFSARNSIRPGLFVYI